MNDKERASLFALGLPLPWWETATASLIPLSPSIILALPDEEESVSSKIRDNIFQSCMKTFNTFIILSERSCNSTLAWWLAPLSIVSLTALRYVLHYQYRAYTSHWKHPLKPQFLVEFIVCNWRLVIRYKSGSNPYLLYKSSCLTPSTSTDYIIYMVILKRKTRASTWNQRRTHNIPRSWFIQCWMVINTKFSLYFLF